MSKNDDGYLIYAIKRLSPQSPYWSGYKKIKIPGNIIMDHNKQGMGLSCLMEMLYRHGN